MAAVIYPVMVGMGASYQDGIDCKLNVCLFLKVAGSMGLVKTFAESIFILYIACSFHGGGGDENNGMTFGRWMNLCCKLLIANAIHFILIPVIEIPFVIWGSIVVFESYTSWSYEDAKSSHFCDYKLYLFSFAIVIIGWCSVAVKTILIFYVFVSKL